MNRFYYILATCYLLLATCYGQNSFYKTISSNYSVFSCTTIQTNDGGYAVVGEKSYNPINNNPNNALIVKTDANGDSLWVRTYGGTYFDAFGDIIQTTDGGYLISGYTYSFGPYAHDSTQAYLIKINANGDTLWTKIYGGTGNEQIIKSIQKNDGGYICLGTTTSFGAGSTDIYLLNLNANGDTLSTRCYGGNKYDIAANLISTPDKGYLLCGSSSSYSVGTKVYVIKTDSLFNVQWSKIYGGSNDDAGSNIIKTNSGNYIIAGASSSFGGVADTTKSYAISINFSGDTLWSKVYAFGFNNGFADVIETPDSNLLFSGMTGASSNQLTITKTNRAGNTLEYKLYNINLSYNTALMSGTIDGGAIIGGTYNDTTGYILKLDPSYNINCMGTPATLRVNSPPTVVTNVATQQHNTVTITRGTHTQIGYGCTITTVCNNTGIEEYANANSTQITLYPNPNGGSFTIEPNSAGKQSMQVYDVSGKLVLSQTINGKTNIDASTLNSGVYFIHITDENGVTIKNDKLVLMGQ